MKRKILIEWERESSPSDYVQFQEYSINEGESFFNRFIREAEKMLPKEFCVCGIKTVYVISKTPYDTYEITRKSYIDPETGLTAYVHSNRADISISRESRGLIIELNRPFERNKEALSMLLKEVFPDVIFEWEDLSEEEKLERIKRKHLEEEKRREEARRRWEMERLERSLTEIDRQILELRKQGMSYWGIARTLGVTINKVRWTLQKTTRLPHLWEGVPLELQPLSREERRTLRGCK